MFRLITMSLLALGLCAPALAKDKETKIPKDEPSRIVQTGDERHRAEDRGHFNSAERNLIRSWLLEDERREALKHPTTTGLPPGLQKKVERGKALPPGWQKKLQRGAQLDHDYYGQGRALPDDLLRRLPPPPPGSEILRIEDQIVRLDAATRVILDVFGLSGY